MGEIFKDPMFFYGIAFAVFLGLVWHYGRRPIAAWLDGEIIKISNELEQARKLRVEAEVMLADYKEKHSKALIEADSIVKYAREEADRQRARAVADIQAFIQRHEDMAVERIRLLEAKAMEDIRLRIIDAAMVQARKVLSQNLSEADNARLIEQALKDVVGQSKSKAIAA